MEITIKLDYRQALEVKGALEQRIDKINRELFQLFEGDDKITRAYQLEIIYKKEIIELLQNAINKILGVS